MSAECKSADGEKKIKAELLAAKRLMEEAAVAEAASAKKRLLQEVV